LIVPIVASVALVLVAYESLNPLPTYPVSLAAPIVVVWLAVGLVVMFVMLSRHGESWLARAGQALADLPETTDVSSASTKQSPTT
jgi:hypothetical protein